MQLFLRFLLLGGLLATAARAQTPKVNIGRIEKDFDSRMIRVRVSANTAELDALARLAFGAHGRYFLAADGFAYDIRFSTVSGTQVRVDVLRGGAPVSSDTATGANARQALLRAADIAVAKTNGLGLRGFFTARLAFVAERTGKKEIYTSDLFLGEAKQITNDRALVLKPRWSPDGSRLLYTSFFKGFPDIFQYDLGSFQRTTFVSVKGTNMGARYSPNGAQVAMVLTGEGTSEIYTSNAQGKQITRRTPRSEAAKSSPAWSPDGSQLVFEMEPGPQLYLMSAGGGTPRRLATGYTFASEPDWSRVSNKIVCTVRVSGGKFQIAVTDPSGGGAKVVSEAKFDAIEPTWLGDGRHIVYSARDRTTSVLCILDTETGKSTPISLGLGGPAMQASAWTP